MIIYITNEEQKDLLDNLAEQYEWELLTEVFNGDSLLSFITGKLQVIQSLPYMVIHRSSVKESLQAFNEVIETIQGMYETRVIVLEDNLVDEEGVEQKVIYGELYTSLNVHQDNLEQNLEYLLSGEKIPEELIIEGVWIGVMSVSSGAGCTDFAIGLANYIKQHNDSVCYVEANESGDLDAMSEFYGMEKLEDNHYVKNGMDYWHQSIDQTKKFVVIDLGKCNTVKVNILNQCAIKLLIADAKPYRMADVMNVYRMIDDEQTKVCLNYGSKEEVSRLCESYLQGVDVGVVGHHGSMFEGNDILYQDVMKDYIKVSTAAPVKKVSLILPGSKVKRLLTGRKKHTDKKKVPASVIDEKPEDVHPEENIDEEVEDVHPEENINEEVEDVHPEESIDEEVEDVHPEESIDEERQEQEPEILLTEPELQEEAETIEPEQKRKKHKPVKTLLILFALVITVCAFPVLIDTVRYYADSFSFNNPITEEATELINSDLNINEDIKLSVLEVPEADGYEVSYSTNENFDKKTTVIIEVTTADKAVESLAAGKTYYVRVRAFKFNEDGIKEYGEYTEVQKIRT